MTTTSTKQIDVSTVGTEDATSADKPTQSIKPTQEATAPTKRKRGRPTKAEVEAKKAGNRGKVGRPKGDASAINEMKARLLASPRSKKVLDSIMSAALDDDHKNQSAAWKLLMDRMLPVSYFEKEKDGGARPSVNITISGIGGDVGTTVSDDDDVIEGDYKDV